MVDSKDLPSGQQSGSELMIDVPRLGDEYASRSLTKQGLSMRSPAVPSGTSYNLMGVLRESNLPPAVARGVGSNIIYVQCMLSFLVDVASARAGFYQ